MFRSTYDENVNFFLKSGEIAYHRLVTGTSRCRNKRDYDYQLEKEAQMACFTAKPASLNTNWQKFQIGALLIFLKLYSFHFLDFGLKKSDN